MRAKKLAKELTSVPFSFDEKFFSFNSPLSVKNVFQKVDEYC